MATLLLLPVLPLLPQTKEYTLSCSRVTCEDRITIRILLDQGKSNAKTAAVLGMPRSTIGREISRNRGGRGYRYRNEDKLSKARELAKYQAYKATPSLWKDVKSKLDLKENSWRQLFTPRMALASNRLLLPKATPKI